MEIIIQTMFCIHPSQLTGSALTCQIYTGWELTQFSWAIFLYFQFDLQIKVSR